MNAGLRELLGLPEPNRTAHAQLGDFRQKFRDGIAGLNDDLQMLAAHGDPAAHEKLASQRQSLYAAYQTAAPQNDPASHQRVIAAVAKTSETAWAQKTNATAGRDEWLKREAEFDATIVKIGELEDASHPKAEAFRKLGDAILSRANDREYEQASVALDQLIPKLDEAISPQSQPEVSHRDNAAPAQPNMPALGGEFVRADSGNANVQLHEEDEPANVTLPGATQGDPTVTMVVKESGEQFQMKRSQIVQEGRYVDNAAQRMWAKPKDLITLEVKTMNFTSSHGKFSVEMDDVQMDMPLPAMRFEMRGGIVYPIDKNGDVAFDKVNTPNIVNYKRWVLQEIDQRRKIRRKIAETTFMFQMALAQLAGAVGPPSVPKGPSPASMKLPNTKAPIRPSNTPKPPADPPPTQPKGTPAPKGGAARSTKGRLFAKPTETGTSSLPAGQGHTDKFGNVQYSTLGSAKDVALVRFHESVHSFLSPKFKLFRNLRADFGMGAYKRSATLRYIEEALAESFAQMKVNGIRGLPTGIKFPIKEGYVTIQRLAAEGAVGTIVIGGVTYYVFHDSE